MKKGDPMLGTYLDPITDFGFKKLLGEEIHSNFLKDLLNELLRDETGEIVEIKYLPNEQLPDTPRDRRVVFDIYCKSERGEYFIVEMQKTYQEYFKDRSIYYSTFPIRAEAIKMTELKVNMPEKDWNRIKDHIDIKIPTWNYRLKPVYTICFVDFSIKGAPPGEYLHYVKLTEQKTKQVFYDKLTYIYVELEKFDKALEELTSKLDYWIYTLKHLGRLHYIPAQFKDSILEDFFDVAQVSMMTPAEVNEYNLNLHNRNQYFSEIESALHNGLQKGREEGHRKGREEGIKEGRKVILEEMVQQLQNSGMSTEEIDELVSRLSS